MFIGTGTYNIMLNGISSINIVSIMYVHILIVPFLQLLHVFYRFKRLFWALYLTDHGRGCVDVTPYTCRSFSSFIKCYQNLLLGRIKSLEKVSENIKNPTPSTEIMNLSVSKKIRINAFFINFFYHIIWSIA